VRVRVPDVTDWLTGHGLVDQLDFVGLDSIESVDGASRFERDVLDCLQLLVKALGVALCCV
jgi:hypothetical protein